MTISLLDAQNIANAAQKKGRSLGLEPLAVAVVDASRAIKCLYREDGAAPLRCELAVGKAWGALSLGMNSRAVGDIAVERPAFFTALSAMGEGKIVPAAGGVLLYDADGEIVGAVGVSGDASDQDEICAFVGAQEGGFAQNE